MIPRLFEIPGLHWPINSYGFMIMVGFLLATWVGVRRGKELGISSDVILDVGIIGMIAGIIGGKINYMLQYPGDADAAGHTPNYYALLPFDLTDGMSWLGGLALGWLPFAWWHARTKSEGKVSLYSWQNAVLLLATVVAALVGTRVMHLVWNRADYPWSKVWSSLQSGFVLYGGLLLGAGAALFYARMRNVSIRQIADIGAPGMMLGVAFGRIGCLLNGCCWGCPTTLPWGMKFPEGSDAAHQILSDQKKAHYPGIEGATSPLPVHPAQVYETIATLACFFVLSWWWRKKKKVDGETFLLGACFYAVWRFLVEFVRGDDRPNWLGSLSYSQTLSLGIFIICAAAFWTVRRGAASAPPPEKQGLASESTPATSKPA